MRTLGIFVTTLLLLLGPVLSGSGLNASDKSLGQEIKEGASQTGKSIKESSQDLGRQFKEKGIEAGKAIKEGVKETGEAFREGAKETKKEAQKQGRTVGQWFKDLGQDLRTFFGGK